MKNKNINFKTAFIQYVFRVLSWISLSFFKNSNEDQVKRALVPILVKMDNILFTRGSKGLITFCKKTRTVYLAYLSGTQIEHPGISITKDGLPLVLGDLIPLIRRWESPETIKILQILNTVLWCTRSLKTRPIPDITPIVQPPKQEVNIRTLGRYTRKFWRAIGCYPSKKRVPRSVRWKKFHMTTKAGPNGQALWHALQDLVSLPKELVNDIKILGGDLLAQKVDTVFEALTVKLVPEEYPISPTGKYRKLSYFPDMEGKVRVIGILDYYSQTVLRPLHTYLFRCLRRIPQDRTFDQGGFPDILREGSGPFYSVDLTNATDRFPISLIQNVLEAMFPYDYVSSWKRIMVDHPFEFKDHDGSVKSISYGTGNPMGAYSSWATFAIAHHYVVFYCCMELKKDWSTLPYALLGDDIVIRDKEVAELYIKVLSTLGVEISVLKTHKSEHFYEFAKRYFINNQEISPFPISALKESQKRYYSLVNLLMESERKGWITKDYDVARAISNYYSSVLHRPSRFCRKMQDKSFTAHIMMKIMRELIPASEGFNTLRRKFDLPGPDLTDEEANKLLSKVCQNLFTESDPRYKKFSDVGDLAFKQVCQITGNENVDMDLGFRLIQSLPVIQVYGQVEMKYLDLKREEKLINLSGEQWPWTLRSMTIPFSDKVFSILTKDTVNLSSAILGDRILKCLRSRSLDPLPNIP